MSTFNEFGVRWRIVTVLAVVGYFAGLAWDISIGFWWGVVMIAVGPPFGYALARARWPR